MISLKKNFSIFYFTRKELRSRNSSRIKIHRSKNFLREIFHEEERKTSSSSNVPCYRERVAMCTRWKTRERKRGTISDTVCYSINSVRLKSAAVTGSLCRVVAISRLFFVRQKQVRRHGIDRSFDISRTSSLGHRVEWASSMNAPFSRIYWQLRASTRANFSFRDVTKLSQYDHHRH